MTLLTLSGELDLATVEQMKPAIEPTMAAVQRGLVVDITAVRFADSSAIAMWVGWSRRVPDIEIRNASPLIRRVIEAMGLDSVLRVV